MKQFKRILASIVLAMAMVVTVTPVVNVQTVVAAQKLSFPKKIRITEDTDKHTLKVKGLRKKQSVKFKLDSGASQCLSYEKHKKSIDIYGYDDGSGNIRAVVSTKGKKKKQTLICNVTVKLEYNNNSDGYDNNDEYNVSKSPAEKLSDYIDTYGGVNSDNNKLISDEITTSSGNTHSYAIVKTGSNSYDFLLTTEYDDGAESGISMTVYMPMYSSILVEDVYVDSISGYDAKGVMYPATYTKDTSINWIVEDSGYTDDELVSIEKNMADSYLSLSMACWDNLLIKKVGISLNDLGFQSYE